MNKSQSYPELLVIGGGFAGIALIKALRNAPYNITLIDKHNYHTFQPLLYQVASGGLGADAIGYPFRLIFRNQKNFNFRMAEVQKILPETKCVETTVGTFKYDYLVIASGSTTNYFGMKEVERWSMPMKTIPEALDLRSDILQEFEFAHYTQDPVERARHMTFLVVGGGPTGVETAGALAEFKKFVLPHDYPELDKDLMQVYLVEAGPRLLAGMSEKSSSKAKKYLEKFGVKVLLNTAVTEYNGQEAALSNGENILTSTVVWSAGVKGQIVDGLPKESLVGNRIKVDSYSRVEGFDHIFALGDVAAMVSEDYPRGHPMVAPVAVQQAQHLAKNLKKYSKSQPMQPFRYKDKGSMATVGRNKAVVDLPWASFGGFFAWLVWMFLHLMLLVGFRNRLVTFIDWTWNYFSYERALRLIVRTFDAEEVAKERALKV